LIGIVLKKGIKVKVSKKMEKWAAQELQYADLGDTRRKRLFVTWYDSIRGYKSTKSLERR